MRHNVIQLLMVVATLWAATASRAYTPRFKHINSQDGLPHQQVQTMVQDKKGYIWIGTRNGLARFDGYDMACYYHIDGNLRSLPNSFVKTLFVDSRGRVWACTTEGLCHYEPATDDFKCYYGNVRHVESMVETSTGRIVCGGEGMAYYDEQRDSFVTLPTPDEGFILSMAVDGKDNLYFATNVAIHLYDPELKRLTRLDSSVYEDFLTGADGVVPLLVDHAGRLWIGRNGQGVGCVNLGTMNTQVYKTAGLVRTITEYADHTIGLGTEKGVVTIRPNGQMESITSDMRHPNLLSDNAIYALLADAEGNRWVGSYFGGVDVMLTGASNFNWTEPGDGLHQLKGKVLRSIVETSPGQLWIATEDRGVVTVDLQEGTSQHFDRLPDVGTNVHSLYYDRERQEMWIGTFRQGLFRYNLRTGGSRRYLRTRGLDSDAIFCIARQRNGRLWLATTQGLRYYDEATDMFMRVGDALLDTRFVYTLCIDRHDNVWAGMANDGLFRVSAATGGVSHWDKGSGGLKDHYVTSLFEDSRGDILIGTNVSGLQYISPDSPDSIRSFRADMNLSNFTICCITEDSEHRVWVSTNQGLLHLDMNTQGVVRFTTDNGLPTNQFNFSSSLLGSDGCMYFGTVQGLVSFVPQEVQVKRTTGVVHWKRLLISNELQTTAVKCSPLTDELDEMQVIRLSYAQARQFTIDYGVVAPATAGSMRYQVYLEGIDRGWHDVGTLHSFNGYRLASGSYVLHVRANSAGDGWAQCPERTLRIVVARPLWLSWWAFLVYGLALSALLYFVWHYYRSKQQAREDIRRAALENEKIRAIDQAKFEFFTTVSHELKTPLSLIQAPLKNIQRQEQLAPEGQRNLDIALKNTQKIEQLVDELVTYNKVETDAFRLYVQQGNPMEFLGRAVQPFRAPARGKGIGLSVQLEDNGEQVWFSPQYVEHIVGNLLSNALKFTPDGGTVTVRACIKVADDGRVYLHIDVADTGIGIAPEELQNVFDRYYQTRRGVNTSASGWGIGLSLVKRLAEAHKGTVGVQSQVGQGSTFCVELCVSEAAFDEQNRIAGDKVLVPVTDYRIQTSMADMEAQSSVGQQDTDAGESLPVLLVVEDHADMRDFLRAQLSSHYKVLTAGNGREAMDMARREIVHLVVSDVMMPEMDGFELCRMLKESMDTSHLPVILLTAKSESNDVATGYRAGADAYVSKPFDMGILEMQISNILKLVRTRQQEIASVEGEDLSAATLTALDRDFLQRMKQLVSENLGNSDFSIPDITAALGVSRSLLHVKMKSLMNMSMGDYIRHCRMERACQMLREGCSVAETAYATGFADPNYFSKTFKKNVGQNPTEYAAHISR